MSAVEPQRSVDRFRHTAVGTVVAAGLLGLRDALEGRPEQEETVMEADAPGAPPPDGLELFLDPDDPTRSIVVVHPVPPAESASERFRGASAASERDMSEGGAGEDR